MSAIEILVRATAMGAPFAPEKDGKVFAGERRDRR
jgi:hypothetical protein